jgi:hypothetical protein
LGLVIFLKVIAEQEKEQVAGKIDEDRDVDPKERSI